MTLVVNTNTTSMFVQRQLDYTMNDISTSVERLSSGYRINSASDDAAGLAIATDLEAQENGCAVAKENAQLGINVLQTAEGDMESINDQLQSIRDLTLEAANGTYSTSERNMLLSEATARLDEINRIAQTSEFCDMKLLDGSVKEMKIQAGPNSGTENQIDISDAITKCEATALNAELTSAKLTTAFSSSDKANAYIANIDSAIDSMSSKLSKVGTDVNILESAIENLDVKEENLASSLSTIRDTDVAAEAASLTQSQIQRNIQVTVLAQANSNPSQVLSLFS